MRNIYHIVALLAVAVIAAALTWQVRGCTRPSSPNNPPVDTVFVQRQITRHDTVTRWRPRTRVIYEEVHDTVYIEVPVPRDFNLHGLISPTPLQYTDGLFSAPQVTLSYFDPAAVRYQQDVYSLPSWSLYGGIGASYVVGWPMVSAKIGLRWRRISGWLGYGVSPHWRGPVVGLRLRLFEVSW